MRKEHPLQYFLVTTIAVGILYADFQLFYIRGCTVTCSRTLHLRGGIGMPTQTGATRIAKRIMIASLFSAIPALLVLAQPDPEQPTPQLSERELTPDTTSPVTLPNLRVRVY